MQTLEQNIFREEYDAISNDIYTAFFTSSQLLDGYAEWLKSSLLKNNFQSKEQKTNIIKFLAKLQIQKELLELSSNPQKLTETQNASKSFSRKSKALSI